MSGLQITATKADLDAESKELERREFEVKIKKAWETVFEEELQKTEQMSKSTKMPWLVPACSKCKLQEKIAKFPSFRGFMIAGLVPGEAHGAPFDVHAFLWQENVPPEWLFEFKAKKEIRIVLLIGPAMD